MEFALLSVIIPTFNAERYIGQVIENIIDQTYNNWELILVDDGSNDTTVDVIKKYAETDPRVFLFIREREPKGSVTCRNIGQQKAHGKYFIHFDADDIIEPFCFEQRVLFMENNPTVDFATFPGESVQQVDNRIINAGRKWGIDPQDDILKMFLAVKYPFSVWNNIYRTESFRDYFWDERVKIYTDFSYIVPSLIMKKKHAFAKEAKVDYLYRIGNSNAMTGSFISGDKFESTKYLFEKTYRSIESLPKQRKYLNAFGIFLALQLYRIALNGNEDQFEDFYCFINGLGGKRECCRIKLFYYLVRRRMDNKSLIKCIYAILYSPNMFLHRFRKKISK